MLSSTRARKISLLEQGREFEELENKIRDASVLIGTIQERFIKILTGDWSNQRLSHVRMVLIKWSINMELELNKLDNKLIELGKSNIYQPDGRIFSLRMKIKNIIQETETLLNHLDSTDMESWNEFKQGVRYSLAGGRVFITYGITHNGS